MDAPGDRATPVGDGRARWKGLITVTRERISPTIEVLGASLWLWEAADVHVAA